MQVASKPLPNIIFLDMDGVLCNPRACLAMGNIGGGFSYLDPIACMLVKRLCEECNAKLVISSAWRILHDKISMSAILGAACPNLDRHIWYHSEYWRTTSWEMSDETEMSDRGREIKKWIEANETAFNNFCILDDMADMRPYQDSLVKCDPYDGLGYHQYKQAEKLLMDGFGVD